MSFEYPVKRLSHSAIKKYIDCPFSFKAKYILKMKQPSNEHFALGGAVHAAAEFQVRFNLKRNKNLPLQVVLEKYQSQATEEAARLNKFGIKAFREMYPVGHDLVEQLYFYLIKNKPVAIEQYFSVDLGYDLPVMGYMDVIFEDDALYDFKTCSKPWPKSKLNNSLQLTIYNEAYKEMYGKFPNTLGIIELNKKDISITPRGTTRTTRDREILDLTVEKVLKGIRDGDWRRCGKGSCFACSAM